MTPRRIVSARGKASYAFQREKASGGPMTYVCHFCHSEVTKEGLKQLPGVKCPHCGGRILYKIRPPVVKRVKGV